MRPLTISLPDYLYKKLAQQAKVSDTSLEELVLFQRKPRRGKRRCPNVSTEARWKMFDGKRTYP